MDASIFDSALSHTGHSDASEKREENTGVPIRLWTSFESSRVSVKESQSTVFLARPSCEELVNFRIVKINLIGNLFVLRSKILTAG